MNVHSRYLEPKKEVSQHVKDTFKPFKERIPVNPAYADTPPRYLLPPESASSPNNQSKRQQASGVGESDIFLDVRLHKELVQRSFPEVKPRYLNEATYLPKEDSPRRLVEAKLAAIQRERVRWRSDLISARGATFDELKRKYAKVEEGRPKPKPRTAPSPVKEYLRHGTPIKHHSHTTDPAHATPRGGSPSRSSLRGNDTPTRRLGSPSNNSASRGGSPMGRTGSGNRRPWHAPGQTTIHETFDMLLKSPDQRPWVVAAEKRIQQDAERRNSLRVEPDHVPRVAGLSLAALAAQEQSAQQQQETTYAIEDTPAEEEVHPIKWRSKTQDTDATAASAEEAAHRTASSTNTTAAADTNDEERRNSADSNTKNEENTSDTTNENVKNNNTNNYNKTNSYSKQQQEETQYSNNSNAYNNYNDYSNNNNSNGYDYSYNYNNTNYNQYNSSGANYNYSNSTNYNYTSNTNYNPNYNTNQQYSSPSHYGGVW